MHTMHKFRNIKIRGSVGTGSRGSTEPVNFLIRVLEPVNFWEFLIETGYFVALIPKFSYFTPLQEVSNPSMQNPRGAPEDTNYVKMLKVMC